MPDEPPPKPFEYWGPCDPLPDDDACRGKLVLLEQWHSQLRTYMEKHENAHAVGQGIAQLPTYEPQKPKKYINELLEWWWGEKDTQCEQSGSAWVIAHQRGEQYRGPSRRKGEPTPDGEPPAPPDAFGEG